MVLALNEQINSISHKPTHLNNETGRKSDQIRRISRSTLIITIVKLKLGIFLSHTECNYKSAVP